MNKMFKKIIAGVAALTVACMSTGVLAADFPDLPEDATMKQALVNAADNGLFKGDDTGLIRPYGNITRAEMGAIIVRAFGAKAGADISYFSDANPAEWYYGELSKAVKMGAFKGDDLGLLNPNSNITFQETFAVAARIFDLQPADGAGLTKITNSSDIDAWATEYVDAVYAGAYWDEVRIRPNDYITRGEFAILMDRLVQAYITEPGEYEAFPEGNVVIRCGNVKFDMVANTGKIIVGDGVEGTVQFDNSDLNVIVGRGGNIFANHTKVYKIRLTVVGAMASISTTQVKDVNAEPYWGIPGTVFNMGSVQVQ